MYIANQSNMAYAVDTLLEFAETRMRYTESECAMVCLEIAEALAVEKAPIDPYKLVAEYQRLKEIMPYYPSEGELMRLALQSMEHAVQ